MGYDGMIGDDVVATAPRLPTDMTFLPGPAGGNALITSDSSTGDIVITGPRQPRRVDPWLASFLGFDRSRGADDIIGPSFAQRYGLNNYRLDTGYDVPGDRSYPLRAGALKYGTFVTSGNSSTVGGNYRTAVLTRQNRAGQMWDAGGLGYIGAPFEWLLSPATGAIDLAQSYIHGHDGIIYPADTQTTDILMTVGGSAGTALGRAGRLGSIAVETALPAVGGHIPNAGGVIRRFSQQGDQVYYRVFSGDSTVGSFLTAIPPRSSAYAREALALPPGNQATFIQEVLVPNGTPILRSRALPQPAWGRAQGGAEQFELLNHIPRNNFGPGRPLP